MGIASSYRSLSRTFSERVARSSIVVELLDARAEVAELTYGQAKDAAVVRWERAWVERLLAAHDHNVSRAARAAKMARSHLRELCQRYGLRPRAEADES